jgi:hypothetical protein
MIRRLVIVIAIVSPFGLLINESRIDCVTCPANVIAIFENDIFRIAMATSMCFVDWFIFDFDGILLDVKIIKQFPYIFHI